MLGAAWIRRSRALGRPASSTLIVILLLSTLLVAAALAYQAQRAARSHRATAENVLRDYATFASWELSRLARRELYDVLGRHLTRLAASCHGRGTLPDPAHWMHGKDG